MSSITNTKFYVNAPADEHWNTRVPAQVVEAALIDEAEPLNKWESAEDDMRIVDPKDFDWGNITPKSWWIECEGPSRKLSMGKYFSLIHKIDPDRPLPGGMSQERFNTLIQGWLSAGN